MEQNAAGIGILVFRSEAVLLGKISSGEHAGMWTPPGGHIAQGENIVSATSRKLQEETGLTVETIHVVSGTNDFKINEQSFVVTIWVKATISEKVAKPQPKKGFSEFKWASLTSLPQPLFPPFAAFLSETSLKELSVEL